MSYSVVGIEPPAFRHRISEERMRYVVANFLVELVVPSFVMLLGYDRELVPLEVGGPPVTSAESAGTALRIVHAMRARPAFRRMLEHLLT